MSQHLATRRRTVGLLCVAMLVVLAGCGGRFTGLDGRWNLTSFLMNDQPAPVPAPIAITIGDGFVSGNDGCDDFRVTFDPDDDGSLEVGYVDRPLASCDAHTFANYYYGGFTSASNWKLDGDELTILGRDFRAVYQQSD